MQIHNLSNSNSILNTFIHEIRSVSIQNDAMRFRRNIERIGEILSYEMSKEFRYNSNQTETPLGQCHINLIEENIVICSILRAGLPLHNGVLNYFDTAENAFISAYRRQKNDTDGFEIVVEYITCPSLKNKILILVDPMLATGQSMVLTHKALKPYGLPKQVHLICAIGSQEGVASITDSFPENTHLWIGSIDEKLNDKGYIVPGLGDAGDLAFGSKLQH